MLYCKDCGHLVADQDAKQVVPLDDDSYLACPYCDAELVNLPEET